MTTRFAALFARLRADDGCALFPYLMAGYPDVATSHALAEAALDLVRVIRRHSPAAPVAVMSYYNPLRQRGDRQVAADLAAAEADAVIAPDLPPEESAELGAALAANDLGLVPFLAPTSPPARIRAAGALDPVYIYCVALVGVTGARQNLSSTLGGFLDQVRAITPAPLVVGFGISSPEHVSEVARLGADGVIVASALADLIDQHPDPIPAVASYVRSLKLAATTAGTP